MRPDQLAEIVAKVAHDAVGQKRKYTGEPYWHHCREVAGLVEAYAGDGLMVAAAWLHDTLEDTKLTKPDLEALFPALTVQWVVEMTDASTKADGNRETRKRIDRAHLAGASPGGKTIKLADLISNARSISDHDPNFARVYLGEMEELLPLLRAGNPKLYALAEQALADAQTKLVQHAIAK